MAWIYAPEVDSSPAQSCRGCDQSPIARSTFLRVVCFSPVWPHDTFPALPSGTISRHSVPQTCRCGSMQSSREHLARTSALQDAERAWEDSADSWFSRCSGLSMKLDRNSCSWKTSLGFELGEPTGSCSSWPASGMTVAGTCYPLTTWERRTLDRAGGYSRDGDPILIPTATATATDSKASRNATVKNRKSKGHAGTTLTDYVTLYPTPTASSGGYSLGGGAPDESGRSGRRSKQWRERDFWPTPLARDARTFLGGRRGMNSEGGEPLIVAVGGDLNPTFVEWLMGMPQGWTDVGTANGKASRAPSKAASSAPIVSSSAGTESSAAPLERLFAD